MTAWFGIPRRAAGPVTAATLVLFGILAAHSILETTRDALFLSVLPASDLAIVYLAIAALAFLVASVNRWLTRRFTRRGTLGATLVVSAATLTAFWFWNGGSLAALYAFYIWTGLLATMSVVQLWLSVGDQWDATLAKPAFAVVGAGGLLGATLGSAAAGLLLAPLAPRDLILVAAAILAVTGVGARFLPRSAAAPARRPRRPPVAVGERDGWPHPYLWRLLFLVTTTQVAVTSANLLFKAVVADTVPAEGLASFFAFFYTGLNGLSLLVQLLLASWLTRRLGVGRVFWVLPVLLAAGSLGFAMTGALLPILLVKLVDGSLRHSLHRTGIELLYLPLPARMRDRYKVTIDGVGARVGQAIGALAVLAGGWIGLALTDLALIVAGSVVVLLVSVVSIKRHYVDLFRRRLREGSIEPHPAAPDLDVHSLEALMGALSSDVERAVLSAIDLLEQNGRGKLVPAVILHHPSRDVVVRSLDLFSATHRRDVLPLARRLSTAVDPLVRAAALRAVAGAGGAEEEETLRAGLGDPYPAVRATAIVGLISVRGDAAGIEPALRANLAAEDPETLIALARAIHDRPSSSFYPLLSELAARPEPGLQAEVARAIAAAPEPAFVPLLIPMLGERRARAEARAALVAIGSPALVELDQALGDGALPRRVRLHIPRTISRFDGQAAADALCRHLERELDTGIGYKILRGLGRMVAANRRLWIDPVLVDRAIESVLRRAVTLMDWRRGLEREMGWGTSAGALLVALLREKEETCAERVFRLLGLRYPEENFQAIWDGLHSADRKTAASARELIEYVLDPLARAVVLALVHRETPGEAKRLDREAAVFAPRYHSHLERLCAMVADSSEILAGLAAHHVAELALTGDATRMTDPLAEEATSSRRGSWSGAVRIAVRELRSRMSPPGVD